MPPFSRPVARIKSDIAAPAKPWRLKIGAAWRMISRRVCAPLLVVGLMAEFLRMRQASRPGLRPTGLKRSITHARVATERSFNRAFRASAWRGRFVRFLCDNECEQKGRRKELRRPFLAPEERGS